MDFPQSYFFTWRDCELVFIIQSLLILSFHLGYDYYYQGNIIIISPR